MFGTTTKLGRLLPPLALRSGRKISATHRQSRTDASVIYLPKPVTDEVDDTGRPTQIIATTITRAALDAIARYGASNKASINMASSKAV
jgi:hypothetical protein